MLVWHLVLGACLDFGAWNLVLASRSRNGLHEQRAPFPMYSVKAHRNCFERGVLVDRDEHASIEETVAGAKFDAGAVSGPTRIDTLILSGAYQFGESK
jgi:hypothetical protein